jgi:hypothetical protein
MKCLQLTILSLWMAVATLGRAQGTGQPVDQEEQPQPAAPEKTARRSFPFEVSGEINFRYLNDDALGEHRFFREYSGSLFLSKTIGRWRFHTELNANTSPEFVEDGIFLLPRRPSLVVDMDSGFVSYNQRDWLQVQAGFFYVPTYWRIHRYQATTLTVDKPLIDQNIFPTALKGGALYGDKYWGEGGVSYIAYAGVDQLSEFQETAQVIRSERARVVGGKLTLHVPSRQFFKTLDVAFHRLHRVGQDGIHDETYGVELQLSKSRFEVLGEFAHASVDDANGVRSYIRQGYYIQPSYRITSRLFAVVRFDKLNRDSRYADQSRLATQSAGLVYRPVPMISLKIEGDRFEPQGARTPAYYGATTSLVWFFHLP